MKFLWIAGAPVTDEYILEELLAKVTKDNLHEEIKSRGPVGKEVW